VFNIDNSKLTLFPDKTYLLWSIIFTYRKTSDIIKVITY
jgi:hypothetical protein